jgi:hypothetical protein
MDQVTDLNSYAEHCFLIQMSPALHQGVERVSLQIFFDKITAAAVFLQVVHNGNPFMAEGCEKKRLLLKLLIVRR